MDKALIKINWCNGGNNYILKPKSKTKFTGYRESVINELIANFGSYFNIVIWSNKNDYYCIPFEMLKHLFVEENKTTGKHTNRWTTIIKDGRLMLKGNSNLSIDISNFYRIPLFPLNNTDLDNDYYIENARAEILIRIGQSKFRKGVLNNFNNKCALSNISESNLLVASHIVPWAHNKDSRGDWTNGICLYIELDCLFDKGYFSLTNELKIIVTETLEGLSEELKSILDRLKDKQLRSPIDNIKLEYLEYHRKNILLKYPSMD